ncbi:hypothetical protein E1301_Tti024232 [Triplophysa tibetana]|uniref:Uncharacterized protein n=1 Tax=Triplophysa tibetana TaxID=1572043 RepID=A0A5A9NLW3_9TELE|nr:hypothetical protein E1301_Tti024232 [Triplophysa tibetana]
MMRTMMEESDSIPCTAEDGLLSGWRWNRTARDQVQIKQKIRDLPGLLKHGLNLRKKTQSPDTVPGPSTGVTPRPKTCSQSFPCAGRALRNAFLSHGPYPAKDKIHLARIISGDSIPQRDVNSQIQYEQTVDVIFRKVNTGWRSVSTPAFFSLSTELEVTQLGFGETRQRVAPFRSASRSRPRSDKILRLRVSSHTQQRGFHDRNEIFTHYSSKNTLLDLSWSQMAFLNCFEK